ncbi:MAG: hypothetical protein J7641_00705 [Cyanobacteria bacterium SID2]|nr:hypothetical protein [Cyanobacteria bacterium SID2]MBP0005078.1 hypothetical protein [Cyanobacteria bacterium SBC]
MSDFRSRQNTLTADFPFLERSHEFRASLNTILMSVELLADEEGVEDESERRHYLDFIRSAADRMNQLLAQDTRAPSKQSSQHSV